tara:strand:+ start:195 stop:392 length:198 start_codon:yes stop_codon:yes gene_type:complete
MNVGVVKKWDQLKGWGFISDLNDDEDYFFNISNVRKGVVIKEGMKVKFDITIGQRGDEAENIGII